MKNAMCCDGGGYRKTGHCGGGGVLLETSKMMKLDLKLGTQEKEKGKGKFSSTLTSPKMAEKAWLSSVERRFSSEVSGSGGKWRCQ